MTTRSDPSVVKFPLGGASFEILRELWPIEDLRLDPENPRLGSLLSRAKGATEPSQREIQRLLWSLPQVRTLAKSIQQNGGLLEDPVVRHDGTLVEGNCRAVALRMLRRERPDDKRFDRAFVRRLPSDVTESQIALLLGDLHIAQKMPWRAYDQAEYVWRMNKELGEPEEVLATHLRWSRDKLANKLAAYQEARAYSERTGEGSAHDSFALFEEMMSRPELREMRAKDSGFSEQFGRWIRLGLITSRREVRDLPAILASAESRTIFDKEGAGAAREFLNREDPTRESGLYWYVDRAARKLESMPLQEIEAVRERETPRVDLLKRLARALERIEEVTGVQLRDPA